MNEVSIKSFTHWGRVTHLCVGKLTIIGSDNGLSHVRRQAIIWTNAGILLIGPLGTKFNQIVIAIHTFSFTKMHLKLSSAKWRPFCLGLNMLTLVYTLLHLYLPIFFFFFLIILTKFCHWLRPKLSFWQLPTQPVTKLAMILRNVSFIVLPKCDLGEIYVRYDVHVYLMGLYIKNGMSMGVVTAAVIRLSSQSSGYYHDEEPGSIVKHHWSITAQLTEWGLGTVHPL